MSEVLLRVPGFNLRMSAADFQTALQAGKQDETTEQGNWIVLREPGLVSFTLDPGPELYEGEWLGEGPKVLARLRELLSHG